MSLTYIFIFKRHAKSTSASPLVLYKH